jgi:Tol biopolymer transport system component
MQRSAGYSGFSHPRAVSIRGYGGIAMEPFVTPDGRYLLFSNRRPFGEVQRVAAAAGYVEAPALSPDGRVLYYHRRVGRRFLIYAATRKRA